MLQEKLAYGRNGLIVDLPEEIDVITPKFTPGYPDEEKALLDGLRKPIESLPLLELVSPGDTVVIVHTDITRATPNDRILPVILSELVSSGIRRDDITLLNGLGTHRPQTDAELRAMLGGQIVDNFQCLQHNCYDDENLVSIGQTASGHPVRINRKYMEADVRILTGFIEPHFFAGFSGGPKAVLPALAGSESVFTNHGVRMISHPKATWGITEGNPIWEEMCEVAQRTNPAFLLNVALNSKRQVTGVFAGDMLAAHQEGCKFVMENSMAGVDEPYDVVITTNSGYPLDQNLYQSVKGMKAAHQIIKKGGAIIIAAACEDGLPDHGRYVELLQQVSSPAEILEMISRPGFEVQDQWQVQIQAQILFDADVYVFSDGLTDEQIHNALFKPTRSIEETVEKLREKHGRDIRICVLPEGPQTIPYVKE